MDWIGLLDISPFSWLSVATALGCGFLVGTERQLRGKPVGIRTSSLITLGTYVFVAVSLYVSNAATDPSRIIGQVVTGVGFLGAGVMLARDGIVVGVTSAATIWVLAGLGVCVAVGGHWVAVKMSVLVVVILTGVELLEKSSKAFTRGVHGTYKTFMDKLQS